MAIQHFIHWLNYSKPTKTEWHNSIII